MLLAPSGCGGGDSGAASPTPTPSPTPAPTPSPSPTPTPPAALATEFGVTCYDLFYKYMWSGLPFDPASRLKALKDRGITLVRFSASPFWPIDWKAWEATPEAHLKALDKVFEAGDTLSMKLIPSVLWYPGGLSDHLGERYSAWGVPNSASRRYLDRHARLIVQRYVNHPSLFIWEFANEMNSFADLPNGNLFFPAIEPAAGTFSERTTADKITIEAVQASYVQFADIVRAYDDKRLIESGSHIPRENQINGANGHYALDSRVQLVQAMEQSMVPDYKTLSIHLYDKQVEGRFDSAGTTFSEILSLARQTADKHGAKLILGEFGVPKSANEAADRQRLRTMLAEIRAAKVDYATAWNYDWDYQPDWSISVTNGRDWMLDEIASANG